MPRPKSRDIARSMSELTGFFSGTQGTVPQTTRPQTGGSVASASGQPSRGTYSQPAAPAVAATNAQGRLAQPRNGRPHISAPIPLSPSQIPTSTSIGLSSAPQPSSVATSATQESFSKGHKRSSTVTSISEKLFGRGGSMFGSRSAQQPHQRPGSPGPVPGKRYPPTSMKEPFVGSNPRASMDSRRSLSYGFRKQTDPSKPRRFSLLPPSFSLKSFSAPKDQPPSAESQMAQVDAFVRPQTQQTNEERRLSTAPAATDTTTQQPQFSASHGTQTDDAYTNQGGRGHGVNDARDLSAQIDRQFAALHSSQGQFRDDAQGGFYQPPSTQAQYHQPPAVEGQNYASENGSRPSMQTGRQPRHAVLQRPNRKFADAYEYERSSHHSGSSGAARKVMDFFRRRGKARAGEDG
jgi:protein-serine/threonine kinase